MKKRVDILLSPEAFFRLTQLEKEAVKIYEKNSSRSRLIEQLIMDTCDPIQKMEERKIELGKEITRLTKYQQDLEKQKEFDNGNKQ